MSKAMDIVNKTINRMKFGWTKYGGANRDIITDHDNTWTCQACGETHSKVIPSFLVTFEDMPTLKLCAKCRNVVSVNEIEEFMQLVIIVRH